MPDFKPNQPLRVFAVLALVAALVLVVVIVATTGGSSDGGGGTGSHVASTKTSKRGRVAEKRGVWIVRSGDTLAAISEETGIDVDQLLQLNPDLDPHALLEGQRIALR